MSPRNNSAKSGMGPLNISEGEDLSTPMFDLYAGIQTEGATKELRQQIYYPITPITSQGPFEWRITTGPDEFLYMPGLRWGGAFKILLKNGSPITADDDVSVVNLAPEANMRSIVFEIDSQKIEDSSYNYGYRAYIEKTLSQSPAAKLSHMTNELFYSDTGGRESANTTTGGNEGYTTRANLFKLSRPCYWNGPLCLDVCGISKPLPPNMNYVIRMGRNEDGFTIMSKSDKYKIEITQLYLEVQKVIPQDNVLATIERKFSTSPMVYEFTRTKIKRINIPQGVYDGSQHGLFDRGQMPRLVLIGLTEQKGVSGVCTHNPFNFKHFNTSEICLTRNNIPIPSSSFRPVWDKGNYGRLYRAFFDNLGFYHSQSTNGITPEMFSSGYFLVPFDLTPDKCNGFHRHKPDINSDLSLRLYFSKATTEVLSLIVYAVYENTFTIHRSDGVETDYTL